MEIKKDSGQMQYDVIISGAGPTGLSLGITCARLGLKTIICEKNAKPGLDPRGETIHDHPILTELLGEGFMESLALHHTDARRFNSPYAQKSFEITRKSPSIIFEWHKFIDQLYKQAVNAGVEFRFNTETTEAIIESNKCIGIKTDLSTEIFGKSVCICDGSNSQIGKKSNIPYQRMNCKITKRLISNFKGEYPGFDYYFISVGSLEYAPKFPPAIIFVFPRDGKNCEVGLMVFTAIAEKLKEECELPDDKEMLRVWHELIKSYPKFSDLMHDTKCNFEYVTAIPTARLYDPPMSIPGLCFIGDSAGFVESSGASGLSCSMQLSKFAAEFFDKYLIQYESSDKNGKAENWNEDLMKKFNKTLQQSTIHKHIKKIYKLINFGLTSLFTKMKTAENINKNWILVKGFYNLG